MGISPSDYQAMCARVSKGKGSVHSETAEDEAKLHGQIIQECLRRGWLAFHGSMAHRTYRTPGEPDFVILRDGGRVLLVECKTRTGKLSADQRAVEAWANKLGHRYHVVRSFGEFLDVATTNH